MEMKRHSLLIIWGSALLIVLLAIWGLSQMAPSSYKMPKGLSLIYDAQQSQDFFSYTFTLDHDAELQDSYIVGTFKQEKQTIFLQISAHELSVFIATKDSNNQKMTQKVSLQAGDTLSVFGTPSHIAIYCKNQQLLAFSRHLEGNTQEHYWHASSQTIVKNKILYKSCPLTQFKKNIFQPTLSSENATITKGLDFSQIDLDVLGSLQVGKTTINNYTYSCNIFPQITENLEFYFGHQPNSQVRYSLQFTNKQISLFKIKDKIELLGSTSYSLQPLQWQKLSIEILNGLISISLNKRVVIQVLDPSVSLIGCLGWSNKGNSPLSFLIAKEQVQPTQNLFLRHQVLSTLQAISNPISSHLSPLTQWCRDGEYSFTAKHDFLVDQKISLLTCHNGSNNYLKVDLLVTNDGVRSSLTCNLLGHQTHFPLPEQQISAQNMTFTLKIKDGKAKWSVNGKMLGLISGLQDLQAGSYGIAIPQGFSHDLSAFSFTSEDSENPIITTTPIVHKMNLEKIEPNLQKTFKLPQKFSLFAIKHLLFSNWALTVNTDKQTSHFGIRLVPWDGLKETAAPLHLFYSEQRLTLETSQRTYQAPLSQTPRHISWEKVENRFIVYADRDIIFNIATPNKSKTFRSHLYLPHPPQNKQITLIYEDTQEVNLKAPTDWLCLGKSTQRQQISNLEPLSPTQACAIWFTKNLPSEFILSLDFPSFSYLANLHMALNTSLEIPEKNTVLTFDNEGLPHLLSNKQETPLEISTKVANTLAIEDSPCTLTIIKAPQCLEIYLNHRFFARTKTMPAMFNEWLILWSFAQINVTKMTIIGSRINDRPNQYLTPRLDLPNLAKFQKEVIVEDTSFSEEEEDDSLSNTLIEDSDEDPSITPTIPNNEDLLPITEEEELTPEKEDSLKVKESNKKTQKTKSSKKKKKKTS